MDFGICDFFYEIFEFFILYVDVNLCIFFGWCLEIYLNVFLKIIMDYIIILILYIIKKIM